MIDKEIFLTIFSQHFLFIYMYATVFFYSGVCNTNRNIIKTFLNQDTCCGYSKEPSQQDTSFELTKHMLKIMGKTKFTISC